MRAAARSLLWPVVGWLTAFAAGCGPRPATSPSSGASDAASISRRIVEDRPPLELVERGGDPRPALAFAVAHDLGSPGSVTAAAIVEARLRARGYELLRVRPQALGFTVELLASTTAAAKEFFRDVHAALTTPLGAEDPSSQAVEEALTLLRSRSFLGPGDAAVARCSGELGSIAGAALPDPSSSAGREQINTWLAAVARGSAAFAAVGPAEFLAAASEGLSASPEWPAPAAPEDPWPEGDSLAVDSVPDGARRLSVALRVPDPDAALLAAEQLGRPSSALALRLGVLPAAFRVERASATIRPRGACLRVDLSGPRADPGPDEQAVAAALNTLESEMRGALASARGRRLPDAITRATDPRDAAAVAAWRALAGQEAPATISASRAYLAHAAERDGLALGPALAVLERRSQRSSLELLQRPEPGQGELWVLLGSPCGTSSETQLTAGRSALFVRALSREVSGLSDVKIEPWIATDGVGFLAHAARRDPSESAEALARRVGSALGRALVSPAPSGSNIASTRALLLDEIGSEPRPGYWLALDALSPDRPSWLEPRGTFATLSDAAVTSLEGERHALLRGPLRVAVLANGDEGQAALARDAVERWIDPLRAEPVACPSVKPAAPRNGEVTLQTSEGPDPEGAYIAVPLPGLVDAVRPQAEATLWLLNRRGGFLEQALSTLPARAEARLVGGTMISGLIVRVSAAPEAEGAAVAQIRGLFDRLARGALTAADVALAERELSRLEIERSLDPRRRVVDLFRGSSPGSELELASLRAFQGRLGSPHQALVYVRSRK